jgi:anti-sigma-K factor RskA
MNPEKHYSEDLPAYAIGALDKDEIPELEAHLRSCVQCQNELAGFKQVEMGLLTAFPLRTPDPKLRSRIQSKLPVPSRTHTPRFQLSWLTAALVGMVLLLIGGNLTAFQQIRQLKSTQDLLASQLENNKLIMAMLSYPETHTYPISGSQVSGTIMVDTERNMAMILTWDMPQLQSDQTYQVWLIDAEGNRKSGGVFIADSLSPFTSTPVTLTDKITQFTGLGVTIEPAGGSPQPTGERVFKVDF